MLRWLTALAVIGASSAVAAAEVIESTFQVEFTRDGQTFSYTDTTVPYLPDSACYYWYVRFDAATKEEVTLVETFRLPVPLEAWRDYVNDPASTMQVAPDAQGATVTVKEVPNEDGWVSHGWCVAEGDPLGPHTISVALDGNDVASWAFSVVAPEDYVFEAAPADPAPAETDPAPEPTPDPAPTPPAPPAPSPQPSPTARDVNQSW